MKLGSARQTDWHRFVERSGLAGSVPHNYKDIIEAVTSFADPLLTGKKRVGRWSSSKREWRDS